VPIRLEDIAQRLGISVTTVSLALKGHPRITEKRREQVLRVARSMGYRPNLLARALATGRAGIVGLIVSDNTDPFYAELIRAVEEHVAEAAMSVILCNTSRDPNREGAAVRMLLSRKVDGIILSPVQTPGGEDDEDRYLRALAREGFPLVIITRSVRDPDFHAVSVDNVGLGRRAVEYLLGRGHRRIGYLGSEVRTHPDGERIRGYRDALREANVSFHPGLVERCAPSMEGGYLGTRRMLSRGERPTAIFAFNDVIALGALRALRDKGVNVPGDMSVLGCDDIEAAPYSAVSLSTMRIPKYEMGARAADIILNSMRTPTTDRHQVVLEATLVERESTGDPPRTVDSAADLEAGHTETEKESKDHSRGTANGGNEARTRSTTSEKGGD
jgi:DNA-binding LacI/PurR family transcriptional regulator